MIAFIGTSRQLQRFCDTEWDMNPRQAFNERRVILVHDVEDLRGYNEHMTIIDTGAMSNKPMLDAIYEQIKVINAVNPE